jgi:hypothetical protein
MKLVSGLKTRLSAAIDWRVREEVDAERKVIDALSVTVAHVSSELTEQIRAHGAVIEELEKRISALEKRQNG